MQFFIKTAIAIGTAIGTQESFRTFVLTLALKDGQYIAMANLNNPKNQPPQDWHPADIVAAIWKRKSSLIRLSRQHGYAPGSLKMALAQPWPAAEKIIADFLGITPQTIWPSRYGPDGKSNRKRGGYHPSRNLNTGSQRSVIQRRKAA